MMRRFLNDQRGAIVSIDFAICMAIAVSLAALHLPDLVEAVGKSTATIFRTDAIAAAPDIAAAVAAQIPGACSQ